ncbi:extracellular solute-binding protein [Clostridiales bacterium COT073_COT-073]|nr:extracellular solute-binding protein [Clostridiales bacterium COT073_COT-073]
MKKLISLLLCGVMLLVLAACGQTEQPGKMESKQEEAQSPSKDKASQDETKKDLGGSLVLYCSMTDDDVETVVDGFGELYPEIKIEVVNGSAGELFARLKAEAGNPQGDVMLGGLNQADGETYREIFEPYISAYENDIYEEYRSDNGYYNYDHLSSVVFCVNTDLEKELGIEIDDYDDLLDPKLASKIVFSNPNESSAAWNNISNIMAVYGYDSKESWDLIEGLMKNKMVIASSSSVCFKAVADGEYVVGLTYEDGAATLLKSGAENIKIVYPKSGSSSFAFGCAVVKGAPHMEAAKAMIDYLMDADSQTKRGNALGTIRLTNKNAKIDYKYIPKTEDVKWVTRDVKWLVENKAKMLEKWNKLYTENY